MDQRDSDCQYLTIENPSDLSQKEGEEDHLLGQSQLITHRGKCGAHVVGKAHLSIFCEKANLRFKFGQRIVNLSRTLILNGMPRHLDHKPQHLCISVHHKSQM